MTLKVTLHGATGRMGLALVRLVHQAPDLELVGAVCAPDDPAVGQDVGMLAGVGNVGVVASPDVGSALLGAQVVVDFSSVKALPALLAHVTRQKLPLVCCTTGLDGELQQLVAKAAETTPVLWAQNTSLGVQVLAEIVEQAVRRLGLGYDVELTEIHHRKKVDAPSGTAKRLADAVKAARPEVHALYGREGIVGARTDNEMAVFGIRGGDVVGDHTVYLLGPGERLELTHRATSRELFAHGALRAARFLAGQAAGKLYQIADVMG
jgi:4-hydroxy-tetrahydrodipicolinate reductase